MKPSIRKGRDSRLLAAAAAVLFLAACAYVGAFLYTALGGLAAARLPVFERAEAQLTGLAVRHERVIAPIPGAPEGERIRTAEGPGVYFSSCDGYESLGPDALDALGQETLSALRDAPPDIPGQARLVEDAVWFFLAEAAPGGSPEPGPCRLRFAGFARPVPARLLEIRETEAGRLLLFRLNEGGEYLKIRWIEAEIERGG